tara:strand:+ start:4576 stop:4995 length:420 start_codon:yes stop_codon:yes gene_type:complete
MNIDFSNFELDHLGIAVNTIEEGLQFYQALGFDKYEIEEVPSEKVKVCFLSLRNQVNIELLEPTSTESPIAKFLAKRGPGIHHICYRVENLEQLLQEYKKRGIRLIDETPRPGAHNCKVAFIHPKASGGVLIELSEKRG